MNFQGGRLYDPQYALFVGLYVGAYVFADCFLSQGVGKWVFGRFPEQNKFHTINEAHKQYSLLDTILISIFY